MTAGDVVTMAGHTCSGVVLRAWDGWVLVRWDVPPRGIGVGWQCQHCEWMVSKVAT